MAVHLNRTRRIRRQEQASSSSSSRSTKRRASKSSMTLLLLLLLVAGTLLQFMLVVDGFAPPRRTAFSARATRATCTDNRFSSTTSIGTTTQIHLRVAYQGVPGAYSEKSTRELLGQQVTAIGKPDFEACFRAVANMEVDYACLPIENSLGGSIHENYDLMLRYDLTIVAEHEFRVQHCVLTLDGVELDDVKYAISHPQALAQCDNYLRGLGITPLPTYDTAGSAKMILEDDLPDPRCTQQNTCAIASDLAGRTYGLNCLAKGVEDDDSNFTRFLLLGRVDKGVLSYLHSGVPSKTSVVFTLPNTAGALYKALACFSLRDIDFSKIESRPTSVSLLNYLKFRSQQKNGSSNGNKEELSVPRFRYCFYLDFLSAQLDVNTENALANLREFTDYVRILGSYPRRSRLVGPVADSVEELKAVPVVTTEDGRDVVVGVSQLSDDQVGNSADGNIPLNIGVLGFGAFGQSLAACMSSGPQPQRVSCLDKADKTAEARAMGVEFYPHYDVLSFLKDLDVVVLSVPMVNLEETVDSLPLDKISGKLVVDVSPLNQHPKSVLLKAFSSHPDIDVLITNPMFGHVSTPKPGMNGEHNLGTISLDWEGRPMVYERARVLDIPRCDQYLKIFERARCQVTEMNSMQHDSTTADAEFVTHMIGRLLDQDLLPPTPVMSKEYEDLTEVAEMASAESFDSFFGMYKHNDRAKEHFKTMRENLSSLERALAAREAYLSAKDEMQKGDRQQLLAETRMLLQELAKNGIKDGSDSGEIVGLETETSEDLSEYNP